MTEQLAKRTAEKILADEIVRDDDAKSLAREYLALREAAREVCERTGDIEGDYEDKFFKAVDRLESLLEAK